MQPFKMFGYVTQVRVKCSWSGKPNREKIAKSTGLHSIFHFNWGQNFTKLISQGILDYQLRKVVYSRRN